MKALVYTATYGDGPRPETLDSVRALTFQGRVRREVGWHNPFGDGDMRNVLAQLERARTMTLKGKYDALLTVEHDMRVPADALQRLWNLNAPVAYGVYMLRHGVAMLNVLERYAFPSRNVGESLSVHQRALRAYLRRGAIECSGMGFGCTLIRREALEAIPFREMDGAKAGCVDMAFATDCLRSGYKQMADLRVQCGHHSGQEWLMPFDDEARTTVEALQDVTVRGGAYSRRLRAGNAYELPANEARDLERAGYVRLTVEAV